MDSKEEHAIVAVKPKPPFRPIFQMATTREGSGVMLIKEASKRWSGGSVFVVEMRAESTQNAHVTI